jgi:hypothetical protein
LIFLVLLVLGEGYDHDALQAPEHGHFEQEKGHKAHHDKGQKAAHDKGQKAHPKDVHLSAEPHPEPVWVPKVEPKWVTQCHEEPEEKCILVPRQECHAEVGLLHS